MLIDDTFDFLVFFDLDSFVRTVDVVVYALTCENQVCANEKREEVKELFIRVFGTSSQQQWQYKNDDDNIKGQIRFMNDELR